jgi:hypothetical protein
MPGHAPFGMSDAHPFWVLPLGNLDVLASEETRIHRTAPRSEHRERGAQHTGMDEPPRIVRMEQRETQLRDGNQRAGDRCPETNEQQEPSAGRHHAHDDRRRRRCRQQPRMNQWNGRCRAQEYETGSRQTARECREQPLHPAPRLPRRARARLPRKPVGDIPLSRGWLRYSSMIPRFSAIVTACVRSFAASLARMFLTWPLTVSSVMES